MTQSDMRKKENTQSSWEDVRSPEERLTRWQDRAFHAAVEKLHSTHGNLDSVMRTGEAFGRGLFAVQIKDKSAEWTIKEWLQEIEQDVCIPLGTEFTFTKISHDVATTFMNRNPLAQASQERSAEALFNFGVMRGLFLSAFPQGELVINELRNKDHPEFIFKTNASARDKLQRERLIRAFTFLKKEDGV